MTFKERAITVSRRDLYNLFMWFILINY